MTELNGDPASLMDISEVERMHNANAAAWRAMIKVVANSEIDFISENETDRTIKLALNTGRVFEISKIPTNVKLQSVAIMFEYMFSKFEFFPMAVEVKEL